MKSYKNTYFRVHSFPILNDLCNPYIAGEVKCIINVSTKQDKVLITYLKTTNIEYHFLPLNEATEDMGWENIVKAVSILIINNCKNIKTLIHCFGGNNRSRVVAECAYYAIHGIHFEDNYKGYFNHLIYNVETGHLPFNLSEIENKLNKIKNNINI